MTDHELETTREEHPSVDSIAGLLATGAIVLGIIALAYRPARMGPVAILVALVAVTMSLRWRRLAAVAMAVAILGWFVGMTIAVLTEHPLF